MKIPEDEIKAAMKRLRELAEKEATHGLSLEEAAEAALWSLSISPARLA